MKFVEPFHLPEANLQAEVYRQCRARGIKCCLEYLLGESRFNTPYGTPIQDRPRADIVIINEENEIVAIVEVKSYTEKHAKEGHKWYTQQIKRYQEFGLPVFIVGRMEKIPELVEWLNQLLKGENIKDGRFQN